MLVDHIGFDIVDRRRHDVLDAEIVVLDAGSIAITLLGITDTGSGGALNDPRPRASQMIFSVENEGELTSLRDRLIEAGASVGVSSPNLIFLHETMIEGILGAAPVPVFIAPADGDA